MFYDVIGRNKIVTFYIGQRLKHHNQPEDNLCGYHDVTVQREETVTPRTARALTSKSLPEIQQASSLIDDCLREQRVPVAFAKKRSLKKRQ